MMSPSIIGSPPTVCPISGMTDVATTHVLCSGPLCNIPVAVRPSQDPNVRMDMHLEKECSVATGKVNSKSAPICARGNCKKVLFSPIRCDVRISLYY